MLKKRIIPCLDIKDGRTVKGVNFVNLKDAGDAVELAAKYVQDGADELVFLDITATIEKRKTLIDLVERVAKEINIPFTVGGGIRSLNDAKAIIKAGADKISINSEAVKNPKLITELADQLGSQCVVLAIDTKFVDNNWKVYIHGGKTSTPLLTVDWAKKGEELGAGEILLTSMNNDGMKQGFAIEITKQIAESVSIPVIASGGAGKMEHFAEVFQKTKVSAALAAGIFHFGEISIPELKTYLQKQNIQIR
ncbi:MAG: imidazole glycerol phosphate synthase subunit HisF [Dysgonamonadaceae bacterium]|nr:imidazole glycerol phosphate synthase subunit HisF [Dysgonamonadaceae bacterium]MDD3901940.1 imidazole glycerol phosphate synthase subunit HisF [Dysgonamonadaceae bacterium]